MAQLAMDARRFDTLGISDRELREWFRGGRLLTELPVHVQTRLHPLLMEAGFDETKPIHVHEHEGTSGVTLYQEPGEPASRAVDSSALKAR